MHLTNVAVQKSSETYDDKSGGKMELMKLRIYLISLFGEDATNQCFADIQNIITKTISSVQKAIINDKHCFEL